MIIENNTAILKDGSIINFFDNGTIEFFPNLKFWKKNSGGIFNYESKERAISIWTEVNRLI